MILVTKTSGQRERVCVCVFIKLHITAQSGPVIYSFYTTTTTACNPPRGLIFVDICLATICACIQQQLLLRDA